MKRITIAALLLAVGAPAAPVLAQSGGQDEAATPRPPEIGTVSGIVTDPQGAAVRGAIVTLSAGQQTVSDQNGQFQFGEVPAGGYAVGVDARGFQSMQMSIRVSGGNDSRLDLTLQAGS